MYFLYVASVLLLGFTVEGCNEAVCGSIVSKCLLTKSCYCDIKNRICSQMCYVCLGHLYNECCSCVEMCPDLNANILSNKSHAGNLIKPVPALFSILTEFTDQFNRWDATVYPVEIDITGLPEKQINIRKQSSYEKTKSHATRIVNCTVIFWSDCLSWSKCKHNCYATGASSYRWFHDGCCECVGQHCINYGINESRCRSCPYLNN